MGALKGCFKSGVTFGPAGGVAAWYHVLCLSDLSSSPSSPEGSPLVPGSFKDCLAKPDQLVLRVVFMQCSCRAVLPDAPADIIIT